MLSVQFQKVGAEGLLLLVERQKPHPASAARLGACPVVGQSAGRRSGIAGRDLRA